MASQKKKEKRASKNAKKKVKFADQYKEQPEPTNNDANHTNDANDTKAKSHGSESNHKSPMASGETDDDDVISIEDSSSSEEDFDEVSNREEFLAQGARQDGMHIQNGVRNLPPEATVYLQECSFVYRHAWLMYEKKDDNEYFNIARNCLLGNIRTVNRRLHALNFDKQYVDEWRSSVTDYKRPPNVRTDKENYVNSFKMNSGLIDTIALIKKEYDSFFDMIPGSKARRKLAKDITITIYAQKSIVYDMGLTYKSIILPEIADKVFFIMQEGLTAVDKDLKSKIIAWLEGDDRDPTAFQRDLIRQVPGILDTLFDRLQGKKPIDKQMKQLEKIQHALEKSNTSMSFEETDHQLGIEKLRELTKALGKSSAKAFRDKLESLKWDYTVYLDAQGWKCIIDDTPALKLKTQRQEEKLLEARPKKKLVEYKVPVNSELDKEKHPLPNREENIREDGDEDRSDNDSDGVGGSQPTSEQDEDDDDDRESGGDAAVGAEEDDNDDIDSDGDAAMGTEEDDDSRESDEDIEMSERGGEDEFSTKSHKARAKNPMGNGDPESDPKSKTSENMAFSKRRVRGPLNPDNRATPFGYIVGGRPIGLFSSRFVVNVGTFDQPVHRIIPGTEFGRNAGPELVKKWPLPMPKLAQDAADRHPADVLDLVDYVEGEPHAKRRPITYYCVWWKGKGSKKKELLWLSRADLISVCGKSWLDKKTQDAFDENGGAKKESRHDIVEGDWRWNTQILADCKARGLHPDTRKPLHESQREDMPWLFLGAGTDAERGRKVKVEPDEESTAHIGVKSKRYKK